MTFDEEHALETYKSLIGFGTEALKAMQLLNGGAIVALLAYLGQVKPEASVAKSIGCPLMFFIIGLSISTFAFLLAYLTQFSLFNELVNPNYQGKRHTFWLWFALTCIFLGLVFFCVGAWYGVMVLAS